MDSREILLKLLRVDGVSGEEDRVIDLCEEILGCRADRSHLGSGVFRLCRGEGPHIVLEAHMDTIGFVVTSASETGFLSVAPVGGVDSRLLPASVLRNVRAGGRAVFCSIPPHLSKGESEVKPTEDRWLDTGGSTEAAAGDRYVFDTEPFVSGDRITASGLDNRAGVCAVLIAAQELLSSGFQGSLSVLLSSMEETGEQGAAAGIFDLKPDLCLCVDVSFAYREGLKRRKCGISGEGPMVGFAPSLPGSVSRGLCEAAKAAGIGFQREIMSGTTGTDADRITISGSGVPTGLVSIPLFEMHTPYESIDLRDMDGTAALLTAYCKEVYGA